jgi:hypothetical protein
VDDRSKKLENAIKSAVDIALTSDSDKSYQGFMTKKKTRDFLFEVWQKIDLN